MLGIVWEYDSSWPKNGMNVSSQKSLLNANNGKLGNKFKETMRMSFTQTTKKLLAQRLIRSALAVRYRVMKILENSLVSFQSKIKVTVTDLGTNLRSCSLEQLVGGERFHTSHTEPYFLDTAYPTSATRVYACAGWKWRPSSLCTRSILVIRN